MWFFVAYRVLPTNEASAYACATKTILLSNALHRVRLNCGLLVSVPPKGEA
jgi:hypothetical protein